MGCAIVLSVRERTMGVRLCQWGKAGTGLLSAAPCQTSELAESIGSRVSPAERVVCPPLALRGQSSSVAPVSACCPDFHFEPRLSSPPSASLPTYLPRHLQLVLLLPVLDWPSFSPSSSPLLTAVAPTLPVWTYLRPLAPPASSLALTITCCRTCLCCQSDSLPSLPVSFPPPSSSPSDHPHQHS